MHTNFSDRQRNNMALTHKEILMVLLLYTIFAFVLNEKQVLSSRAGNSLNFLHSNHQAKEEKENLNSLNAAELITTEIRDMH